MKERIKSIILITLVISSLFLSARIWFSDGLWPDGYNLFLTFKQWPIVSWFFVEKDPYSIPQESLSKARKIVASYVDETPALLYNSDANFNPIFNKTKEIFNGILSEDIKVNEKLEISKTDLKKMFDVGVYVYVNFSIAYTPKLFGQFMGVESTDLFTELSLVRDFVFIPAEDTLVVNAIDAQNGKIWAYKIKYETKEFSEIIKNTTSIVDAEQNCSFALNQNLDVETVDEEGKPLAGVVFDPFVVISGSSMTEVKSTSMKSVNPLFVDGEIVKGKEQSETVKKFEYNPDSVGKTIYTDGTVVYFENDSNLKLYPDGLVEYVALSPEKGIRLIESGSDSSLYESVNKAIEFTEDVWRAALPDVEFNACVSSNLVEKDGEQYTFTLDYFYKGTPVVVDAESKSHDTVFHAAEIKMEKGILTSFKLFIRSFVDTGEEVSTINNYQAIDKIYLQLNPEEGVVHVQDLYTCFLEDGKGLPQSMRWTSIVDDENVLLDI